MAAEKNVEMFLINQVKALGGVCWKFVSPSNRGVPDRIVIYKGQVHFVEVKAKYGKLSPLQEHTIKVLRSLGASVAVVYSKEDVTAFVRAICLKSL